jgi:hypothetical protein
MRPLAQNLEISPPLLAPYPNVFQSFILIYYIIRA